MPRGFIYSSLKFSSQRWPRSVSRKTSDNDVKNILLFEEV